MRCVLVALALGAVALSGCVDLSDVAQEGCGNLVLNANEDCDGSSQFEEGTVCAAPGNANACFYTCDPMDSASCPAGWGCGKDLRCRRPSGEFDEGPGSPWRFSVDEFAVGDVDGDGHVDLIGNDLATITVRYNSGNGEFPTEVNTLIQAPQGPVTYGYLNSDNRLDAVVPIGDGIFTLLGDRSRNLEPVPYAPFEIPSENEVRMVPVESAPNNINTEILVITGGIFEFIDSLPGPSPLPMGYTVDDLQGEVPVANLDFDAQQRSEFALAFFGADRIWVYSSMGAADDNGNSLRPIEVRQVTVPGTVDQGAHFADVNGDGLLDLMVSVTILNQPRVAVAYNSGGVLAASATVEPVFTRQNDTLWPLAAGDINGDGKADYVFEEVIAIADFGDIRPGEPNGGIGVPTQLVPTAFISTDLWREAVIGDFNKDGFTDVAVLTDNVDGVSFFINIGIGIFNRFYRSTERSPNKLRVGDFDGDLIMDVAYIDDGAGLNSDEVSVMFGSPSAGPSNAVSMGKLGYVNVMQPMHSVTSLEGLDAITDLMIVADTFPDGDAKTVAILRGSSSRRMISPFTLLATDPDTELAARQPDIPRRAVVGKFSPDDDDIADIVALAEPVIDFEIPGEGPSPVNTFARLWTIPGKGGDGSLDSANATFFAMPGITSFQNECATWISGDIDGAANGRHELVGIDSNRDCYGFGGFGIGTAPEPRLLVATTNGSSSSEPFTASIQQLTGEERVADNIVLRDLDGDGDLDLLILFAGDISTDVGGAGSINGSRVLVVWNENGQLDVSNTSEVQVAETSFLFDVQSIRLDADTTPELLILADGAVYVSWLDTDSKQYGDPQWLWDQYGGGRAGVGDFNGDGLDDIAYTVDNELVVLLQRQDVPLGQQQAEE